MRHADGGLYKNIIIFNDMAAYGGVIPGAEHRLETA